jgi:hypothetical protein
MPNIRTFDVPQLGLNPSEIGVEATAAAARRGGTFYNQAAQAFDTLGQKVASTVKDAGDLAINYIEHREISSGAAKLAQIEDGWTGAWQKFAADPNRDWNDPTTVQQFRASMEPSLQQFKDSFITERGSQWAEGRVAQFREHMFHKTASDQSTMSAAAIAQNMEETVNSGTNRVYKDPSALDDAIAGLHNSVSAAVDSSPTLEVSARAQAKTSLFKQDEKLVKAAIQGAIDNGGDWRQIAEKYSKYVNSSEMAHYAKEEEQMDRAIERDKRTAEAEERRQNQQNALDRADEYRSKYIDAETGNYSFPPNFRAIVERDQVLKKYPAAKHDLLKTYNDFEKGQKDEKLAVTSARTARDLEADIRSGQIINGERISQAFEEGKLTRTDHDWLQKKVQEGNTVTGERINKMKDEFIKRITPQIDKAALGDVTDTTGGQRLFEFSRYIDTRIQEFRSAGKNWQELFNPNSPDYLAHDIGQFQTDMQRDMQSRANSHPPPKPSSGLPSRNAGESASDYLKRIGR